jgi:anti-sigma factor RsiW
MHECDPQRLSAWLDDELNAAQRQQVEAHLASCDACRRLLQQLTATSSLIQRHAFEPLNEQEMDRLHQAIDAADDQPILRLGLTIAALAASVLIVAGAWLMELPAGGGTAPAQVQMAAAPKPWERLATTLEVDPLTTPASDSIQVADAELAQWMLDGLSGASR